MTDLMKIVLLLSASGTVLAAALALLRRVLRDKLPKAVFYYLWLLVLLRLIVPAALPVPGLELPQPAPVETVVTAPPTVESTPSEDRTPILFDPSYVQTVPQNTVITGNGLELSFQQEQTPWHEQAWSFLCEHFALIWLTGALLHFLWFAVSYFRFSRSLKRDCAPLLEHEQALLDNLRGKMQVAACRSPLAQTPMLLGLLRPRIVLPETAINTRELEYILRHELTHLRRRDLWYKWFTVAVTSVHWFNPLMPWLRREIARCGELSCDEGVIRVMDEDHKRLYGETLLALAAAGALPRAVPATTLCEEKQQLKERLLGIMKYKKVTVMIALLSVLLALLVAGCAAVLGPQTQKDAFTGPLTEEQQAPVLENIRLWAVENIQVDGEITVTYSEPNDQPQSLGWLAELSQECYLYDLHTGNIGPVDGTYPDTADLGRVLVQGKVGDYNRMWAFYLTNGDPAKAVDLIQGLEQLAADYPGAKVGELRWFKMEGKGVYITVDFETEAGCCLWQYSSVSGQWGVTPRETGKGSPGVVPLDKIPGLMTAVVDWQETYADEYDRENYSLNLDTTALARMNQSGSARDFLSSNWTNIVVYDLATGEITNQGREYTGTTQYGHLVLLYPAKTVQEWVYVIDENAQPAAESEPIPDLTGQVAVLTKNAPLDNAFAQTVDAKGNTIVMDMAMALKKGDLVYVESQEGETCNVTVLAGEPPRVQGQLDVGLLSTDQEALQKANQVILQDTQMWSGDPNEGLFSDSTCTGVANVERRETVTRDSWSPDGTVQTQEYWLLVTLPGGDNAFWARREDVVFEWPLEQAPVDLAGKAFYYEGGGFSGVGEFTLKLHTDGTFGYYEGLLSSHIGLGNWELEGDILTLWEDTFSRVFRFRAQEGSLYYVKESSSPFTYVQLEDGARFLEDTYTPAVLRAYGEVLWNAYLKGELPDGSKLDWWSVEEAAKNHFAITDIDGDGRTELLLSWTNASTAGHDFVIFDYRDGNLQQTDLPFTSLRFFDNGAVEVDSSHNQGWAGRFWPFSAYTYDPKTDDYVEVGYTDGWDKQLQPEGFPDDLDADGDGLVYEVRVGSVTGSRYAPERMMDGPAFEEWRQSYLNGAQEVAIELTPLTEENIAALGAPKPNVPQAKPVG